MKNIVVLKGDGIGPEIIDATISVIDALALPISWQYEEAGVAALEKDLALIPNRTIEAVKKHKVVLKGPMTTPVGKGFKSVNVQMRQLFDLSSNIRPSSTKLLKSERYKAFDIVVFRENTEGLYGGKEYYLEDGTAVAEKRVTCEKSKRIMVAACEYAVKNGYKKVTIGHKANILKLADGLFLKKATEVGALYPTLEIEALIIDNLFAKVVSKPEDFELIVTTNLYGDILSDMLGGMVGSIGVLPSINIGEEIAFFEPVHGSAPDIAGRGFANPIGAMLSGALLLKHIGFNNEGDFIEVQLQELIGKEKLLTADLGGDCSTEALADALIKRIKKMKAGEMNENE